MRVPIFFIVHQQGARGKKVDDDERVDWEDITR